MHDKTRVSCKSTLYGEHCDCLAPQRQDSLYSQLHTVYNLANQAGCYDAADFIKREIESIKSNLHDETSKKCSKCLTCLDCTPSIVCRDGELHA